MAPHLLCRYLQCQFLAGGAFTINQHLSPAHIPQSVRVLCSDRLRGSTWWYLIGGFLKGRWIEAAFTVCAYGVALIQMEPKTERLEAEVCWRGYKIGETICGCAEKKGVGVYYKGLGSIQWISSCRGNQKAAFGYWCCGKQSFSTVMDVATSSASLCYVATVASWAYTLQRRCYRLKMHFELLECRCLSKDCMLCFSATSRNDADGWWRTDDAGELLRARNDSISVFIIFGDTSVIQWFFYDFQSQLEGGRLHPGHWPPARQMGVSEGDAAADCGESVCVCWREEKNMLVVDALEMCVDCDA